MQQKTVFHFVMLMLSLSGINVMERKEMIVDYKHGKTIYTFIAEISSNLCISKYIHEFCNKLEVYGELIDIKISLIRYDTYQLSNNLDSLCLSVVVL